MSKNFPGSHVIRSRVLIIYLTNVCFCRISLFLSLSPSSLVAFEWWRWWRYMICKVAWQPRGNNLGSGAVGYIYSGNGGFTWSANLPRTECPRMTTSSVGVIPDTWCEIGVPCKLVLSLSLFLGCGIKIYIYKIYGCWIMYERERSCSSWEGKGREARRSRNSLSPPASAAAAAAPG